MLAYAPAVVIVIVVAAVYITDYFSVFKGFILIRNLYILLKDLVLVVATCFIAIQIIVLIVVPLNTVIDPL